MKKLDPVDLYFNSMVAYLYNSLSKTPEQRKLTSAVLAYVEAQYSDDAKARSMFSMLNDQFIDADPNYTKKVKKDLETRMKSHRPDITNFSKYSEKVTSASPACFRTENFMVLDGLVKRELTRKRGQWILSELKKLDRKVTPSEDHIFAIAVNEKDPVKEHHFDAWSNEYQLNSKGGCLSLTSFASDGKFGGLKFPDKDITVESCE